MPYETSYPSWIQQVKRDDAAAGFQMGQNILEGLKFQERKKNDEFARQQYVAEAPLRDARLAQAIAQQKITEFNANSEAIKYGLIANSRLGMSEAMALEADIQSSENGWTNPEARARVAALIQKFPGLGEPDNEWLTRINRNFDIAANAERQQRNVLQQIEERNVGDLAVQEARNEGLAARGNEPADIRSARLQALQAYKAGRITEDQIESETDRILVDARKTNLQRRTEYVVDSKVAAGNIAPQEVKDLQDQVASRGGRAALLSDSAIGKIADQSTVVAMTDQVVNRIDKFEQKFGSLDEFIGAADVPINQWLDVLRKRNTPKALAALDIFQEFIDVKNGKIKTISGGTVTTAEAKRMDGAIGSQVNKNFIRQIRNFRDNERTRFNNTLESYEGYTLPKKWRAIASGDYSEFQQPTAPGTGGATAPAAPPSGFKVIRKVVRP